jgi:hypothetical protein
MKTHELVPTKNGTATRALSIASVAASTCKLARQIKDLPPAKPKRQRMRRVNSPTSCIGATSFGQDYALEEVVVQPTTSLRH